MTAHGVELKIPTVAVGLLAALLMWPASWSVPRAGVLFPGRYVIAGCLALVGASVSLLGAVSFKRVKTTGNPLKP
jgi:hypothetical protein